MRQVKRRKGYVVLSLFGGIEAGYLAMQRSSIKIDKYYSSEIDEYPIKVVKSNFPDVIHIGDITKWESWDIDQPDIVIGGSACQNLSFAGNRAGLSTKCKQDIVTLDQYQQLKEEGFEFEGQSHLFWEMIAIRNHYKPTYFFLENVMFVKKWRDVFNEAIGSEPDVINSALVSAQNRVRQYWLTKFNRQDVKYEKINITQPEDKGILLKDVVFSDALFVGRMVGRRLDKDGVRKDYSNIQPKQRLELRVDDKSGTITTVQKDNTILTKKGFSVCMHNLYGGFGETEHRTFLNKSPTLRTAAGGGHIPSLLLSEKAIAYMNREVKGGRTHWDFKHHSDVANDKSAAVVANFFKGVPYNVLKDFNCIRYFDPIECCRLQTFPENFFDKSGISKSRVYKALGNSWTVDVIVHIFNHLKGGLYDRRS